MRCSTAGSLGKALTFTFVDMFISGSDALQRKKIPGILKKIPGSMSAFWSVPARQAGTGPGR
jgi:hypothetical protein